MLTHHIFQIQRRYPFTAGFDHILYPVGDLEISFRINIAHVSGMQPSVDPEFFGFLLFLEIVLCQPGGSQHHFPGRIPVTGQGLFIRIHHLNLGKRYGKSCFDNDVQFFILFPIHHFQFGEPEADDRTGFRHSVSGINIYAEVFGCFGKPFREPCAPDDDFPIGEVRVFYVRTAQKHLQNCGYAMRKGHVLIPDQFQQHGRFILSGIYLFYSEQSGNIRNTPGMNMEHRRDRHIHII